jgi:hypothetical protein
MQYNLLYQYELKINVSKNGLVKFLFHGYEIQDAGSNEGGDMSLSAPRAAPALSDDDRAPVREVSHEGCHSRWDETPSEGGAGN